MPLLSPTDERTRADGSRERRYDVNGQIFYATEANFDLYHFESEEALLAFQGAHPSSSDLAKSFLRVLSELRQLSDASVRLKDRVADTLKTGYKELSEDYEQILEALSSLEHADRQQKECPVKDAQVGPKE